MHRLLGTKLQLIVFRDNLINVSRNWSSKVIILLSGTRGNLKPNYNIIYYNEKSIIIIKKKWLYLTLKYIYVESIKSLFIYLF